jgi:serine/threonine-protein kinase
MQGQIINGFELKRLLGRGGMAEVWYAENEIGKPAAVKILNESLSHNQQIVERFHNEALVMVKLNHPNVRQVYGYGYLGERHCIIMEYLEGDDLDALLKAGRKFTDEELQRWWDQTVDALNYTHAMGIVHRDIKPSNIFLDEKGNIKLLDFGIAKMMENASLTQTGMVMGTPMYMSPEQVNDIKHVDYHTDLYSLAVSFVHMLTGKKPYDDKAFGHERSACDMARFPGSLSGKRPAEASCLAQF